MDLKMVKASGKRESQERNLPMKEDTKRIRRMDTVFLNGHLEIFTKEIFKMMSVMEKGL